MKRPRGEEHSENFGIDSKKICENRERNKKRSCSEDSVTSNFDFKRIRCYIEYAAAIPVNSVNPYYYSLYESGIV
jgi:hypothetical protein